MCRLQCASAKRPNCLKESLLLFCIGMQAMS